VANQGNQKTGGAKAALGRTLIDEGLLKRPDPTGIDALNGDDVAAGGGGHRHQTRGHGPIANSAIGRLTDEHRVENKRDRPAHDVRKSFKRKASMGSA